MKRRKTGGKQAHEEKILIQHYSDKQENNDTSFLIRNFSFEGLLDDRAVLELECPVCGHSFSSDYFSGFFSAENIGACEKCLSISKLSKEQFREFFEKELRRKIETAENSGDEGEMDRLGQIIAKAAIVLEPLLIIFVVGFWGDRIGQYLASTQLFLARIKKALGYLPLLLAFPPKNDCNSYLTDLWRQTFIISPVVLRAYDRLSSLSGHRRFNKWINLKGDHWALTVDRNYDHIRISPNAPLPRQARHLIDLRELYWGLDPHGLINENDAPRPYVFDEQAHSQARQWLLGKGLSENDPYVCFIGRDTAYLKNAKFDTQYPLNEYRNVDIQTFIPAMEWLAGQGSASFRMGYKVAKPVITDNKQVHDYAVSGDRSEFLDIYLSSHCEFFVSSGVGLDVVPIMNSRPLLMTNVPLYVPCAINNSRMCVIFKKIYCKKRQAFLSLREIFERY